ncbi:MAG TPA: hypothetical protein DCZ94_12235 [Lentisphaeria bacterium]|nr:MAG: hypothetical protein A2X48_12630 [Lentisphaerae bacterium GWF2_49_21]HBC87718.1 hypothetical protein [Lentisphaeria bacterium]
MKILSLFLLVSATVLMTGCGSTYYLKHTPQGAEFSAAQRGVLTANRSNVPCRVEVICPDDMVGELGHFSLAHYPLKQILKDTFSNAVYASFNQPGGEVVDAFTLQVNVFKSELDMHDETYTLVLLITLQEPGEKKVLTLQQEKTMHGEVKSDELVPDIVYDAAKELAIESVKELKTNPKVIKTVSRFEEK